MLLYREYMFQKIKEFFKKYWKIVLAATASVVGVVVFFLMRKPGKTEKEEIVIPVLEQKIEAQEAKTTAQVEAAAVIAEARGEESAIIKQVEAIAKEEPKTTEDKKKQLEELANLANMTR